MPKRTGLRRECREAQRKKAQFERRKASYHNREEEENEKKGRRSQNRALEERGHPSRKGFGRGPKTKRRPIMKDKRK